VLLGRWKAIIRRADSAICVPGPLDDTAERHSL
jgi:hypothetical protein